MIKVYGPYGRKDLRKHVVIYDTTTATRRTMSYARWLMTCKLGRELTPEETVDHIDGDFTNDGLDNLQILTLIDNIRKSSTTEMITLTCQFCGASFSRPARAERQRIKKDHSGPYCNKSCSGKANH